MCFFKKPLRIALSKWKLAIGNQNLSKFVQGLGENKNSRTKLGLLIIFERSQKVKLNRVKKLEQLKAISHLKLNVLQLNEFIAG